ncbi:MAG: YfhO family protein, partial [Nitrososphaera sp.]
MACFILPASAIVLLFAFMGLYPFGTKSVLVSDMSQQYIDFFAGFRNILTGQDTLFYTWTTGMGMNFIGLYAYYLSSPFSFIVLLFPKAMITEAVMTMVVLKVGTAGIAFSFLLKRLCGRGDISHIAFSVMYALMSYNVIYYFNVMWLDGVVLLPVVALGVIRLLEDGKAGLLLASLFVLFVANFYIAFMVVAAVFLFFLLRLFGSTEDTTAGYKLILTICFCASVLVAGGLAAVLLLPAYHALSGSYTDLFSFRFTGDFGTKPAALLKQMFIGSYSSIRKEGSPIIYCGVMTIILLPAYFMSSEIRAKEKILAASGLVIYLISFVSWDVAVMWHAFR